MTLQVLESHLVEEHITGAELLNNATWATAQPDANVTVLIPGFPGAVFLGTFVTGGYGPPARVIGVQTPRDCDSIVYIIDQVRGRGDASSDSRLHLNCGRRGT